MTLPKKRRSIFVRFRNYFIAGIVVLIPIGITAIFNFILDIYFFKNSYQKKLIRIIICLMKFLV